jgi:predicted RNase H-like HicB family nuclease
MAGYIALVHKNEGTSYGVSFADVPGCVSAGDTFEVAVANAAEALAGHFASMRADGESIPSPRSFDQLRHDPNFVNDGTGAIVTIVTPRVMITPPSEGEKPFHPAYGMMKGLIRIMPGTDLTQPADPEWADRLDALYGPEKRDE